MSTPTSCMVGGCRYQAEAALDDFQVCLLHDSPKVRAILEALQFPHAYWMNDRPIVLPTGPLTAEHFHQEELVIPPMDIGTCPLLAAVPDGPNTQVHPDFDLTR